METPQQTLEIGAVAAILLLPLLSAIAVKSQLLYPYYSAYFRCLVLYGIGFLLFYLGYAIQGFAEGIVQVAPLYSGWERIKLLMDVYPFRDRFATIALVASITLFVVLTKPSGRLAIKSLRVSFICLTGADLFEGVNHAYTSFNFATCIIFNLIGALAFGALMAPMFSRLLGSGTAVSS